jgi:hypothetical protein
MAEEQKRYRLAWREGKAKHTIVSPFVPFKGAALSWLLQMKPYLLWQMEDIEIKAWQRSDKIS